MAEEKRLGQLKKYVPLLDYILTTEEKHKDKFATMRQWILANKKFSKEYYQKIEQALILKYNDLGKNDNFPKDLHKIFIVDLCCDHDNDSYLEVIPKQVAKEDQKSPIETFTKSVVPPRQDFNENILIHINDSNNLNVSNGPFHSKNPSNKNLLNRNVLNSSNDKNFADNIHKQGYQHVDTEKPNNNIGRGVKEKELVSIVALSKIAERRRTLDRIPIINTSSRSKPVTNNSTQSNFDPRLSKTKGGIYVHNTQLLAAYPQNLPTQLNQKLTDSNKRSTTKTVTYTNTGYECIIERLMEKQRKLEEKLRIERAAKAIKDKELLRPTEHAKKILNTRKNNILGIVNDLTSEHKENINSTKNSNLNITLKAEPNFSKGHANNEVAPNMQMRRKNILTQDKALEKLKCTVKRFNKSQDFISTNSIVKHRSSTSTREPITPLFVPVEVQNPLLITTISPNSVCQMKRERDSNNENSYSSKSDKSLNERNVYRTKSCKVILKRLSHAKIARYTQKCRPACTSKVSSFGKERKAVHRF